MTTIKINNQELPFTFKFKQIRDLVNKTGKELSEIDEAVKDLNNMPLIASLGTGKSIEEIEEMIDADGTFECIKSIAEGFKDEVLQYFSPNSHSQTN